MVSLKLQVTSLKQVCNMVEVLLYPYNPPPSPEETERARAEAELNESQPPISSEDEEAKKIFLMSPLSSDRDEATVQMFIRTWRKEMPEVFKSLESQSIAPKGKMQTMEMRPISIHQVLYFTLDQYRQLGSPPLLSILTINVEG